MKQLQKELALAEDHVIADIKADACTALGAGCFAAGTKLWTPSGYRAVESFAVGDEIFSRDQFNPAGLIEAKVVEQIFMRLTEIWHLHVDGQLIRTTGERR